MIAPTTRPTPIATSHASRPYQNESVRSPTITAATTASTNVIGLRSAATVHRMRKPYVTRGRHRHDKARDVQRRRLRDRRDAARARDRRQHLERRGPRLRTSPPLAVVPRLRDELHHDRDHLDEPPHLRRHDRPRRSPFPLPQPLAADDGRVLAVSDEAGRRLPAKARRAG